MNLSDYFKNPYFCSDMLMGKLSFLALCVLEFTIPWQRTDRILGFNASEAISQIPSIL